MTTTSARPEAVVGTTGGLGDSVRRPDGRPKVRGEFAFAGDLWAEGMLWGRTLRSPHAAARILRIDTSAAAAMAGVRAVLTAADVPGSKTFGLEVRDQPVFADEVVRHVGEPVAAVAADHPEIARRACDAIVVEYEVGAPLVDPSLAADAPAIHPDGNVIRRLTVRTGDPAAHGPVVVEGTYEVGMQDQAFMGPEAGLALPDGDGGVDLRVSTQWLHNDRDQVAECLGVPTGKVRIALGGVGGAFGAREDVSLHVHTCLLALATGRPVKLVYSRQESFLGHVHRHPARIWMRHTADEQGRIVSVEARIELDGGAYRSSSHHVCANAACFAAGPYRVPNAHIEAVAVRTNNPPCGAMRGFGAVQICFAHEAQMDRLACALGIDPVVLRLRNALAPGDRLLTGQVVDGALPVERVIRECRDLPAPPPATDDVLARPGGSGRASAASDVRRGVGFAVGFKNLMYAEGYRDGSEARCRLEGGVATITCAAAEVGQGFVTLVQQIARTTLGVDEVVLGPSDTSIGSAGSTSASRQTWMSGGAVEAACLAVRDELFRAVAAAQHVDVATLSLVGGMVVGPGFAMNVSDACGATVFEATRRYDHRDTGPLDADGQGDAHVAFACVAHRATVDVDVELGLVKVVQIATAQDVGRVLNPLQAVGQVEGGTVQGLGLALMEELVVVDGQVCNPSFTDYLIPTTLDAPDVAIAFVEEPEPFAPFGAKGIGEPPTISSTAAVAAAVRAASGAACRRVPIRPADIALP